MFCKFCINSQCWEQVEAAKSNTFINMKEPQKYLVRKDSGFLHTFLLDIDILLFKKMHQTICLFLCKTLTGQISDSR